MKKKTDFELTVESISDFVLSKFDRIREKVLNNEKLDFVDCLFASCFLSIIKDKESEKNE